MKARVGHEMGNVEVMVALAKRYTGVSLQCYPGDWTEKGEMEAEACEVTEACCGALCKFSYTWKLSGLERALFLTLPDVIVWTGTISQRGRTCWENSFRGGN